MFGLKKKNKKVLYKSIKGLVFIEDDFLIIRGIGGETSVQVKDIEKVATAADGTINSKLQFIGGGTVLGEYRMLSNDAAKAQRKIISELNL